jgi:hypothetical protein
VVLARVLFLMRRAITCVLRQLMAVLEAE